ncbi:hypothetical protein AB0383_20690 [Amycolatopsis sp. NPDC051373]|uniref:phage tail fiber protein n=1 Tax=Amycolatopsis sp. NPDC051373 TaxID=3155801 RepID=UPI00344F0B60
MASGLVTTESDRLVNASLGVVAYTAPTTPMKLSIHSTTSSASAVGTEASGGSYARQSLAFTTASGGTGVSNTGVVSFTNMPAGTWLNANIWDSAGTPRREWFGDLTASKTTASGDTLSFAVGAITVNDN